MFIIRKIILLLLLAVLLPFSNFIYDEDDWFVIKNLGQIQSFTENNYNKIIIGTINGIFIYDKLTDELLYDIYLTRDIPSINIKNIFYDKNTDHIWVYHDEGVSFKPFSSFSYHHLSRSDLIDLNPESDNKNIKIETKSSRTAGVARIRSYSVLTSTTEEHGQSVF